MTDKSTLILSWVLLTVFIPISFWNMDAGMVAAGIAAMIRWEDIRKADKAIKTSKDKYWISYGCYLVTLAAMFLALKLSGALPSESTMTEGRIIILAILVPHFPRFIRHEYSRYIQEREH